LTTWPQYDWIIVMTAGVAELKSKLSRYWALAKAHKQVLVTSHSRSIAKIVPIETTASDLVITPARKPVSSLKRIKGVKLGVDLVTDLLANRQR
jgi:antitoxin (DNA-binding transcriptional repressor) of toxin-antitoxin stability system